MKNQRGQTLLEVLLALGATLLVVGAITTVVISSLNNAQFTKNQNLANNYAREGLEVIRKIRDSDWTEFRLYSNSYCLSNVSSHIDLLPLAAGANCGPNLLGIFSRQVDLTHTTTPECADGNSISSLVKVTVSWSDGKCPSGNIFCHKVGLISCLSNLDEKPTP